MKADGKCYFYFYNFYYILKRRERFGEDFQTGRSLMKPLMDLIDY